MDRLLNLPTPEPPEKLNATVSPALSTVLLRALSQDSSTRFPTSTAFAEAIASAPSAGLRLNASNRAEDRTPGRAPVAESISSMALSVRPHPPDAKARRSLGWRAAVLLLFFLSGAGGAAAIWLRSSRRSTEGKVHAQATPVGEAVSSSPMPILLQPDAAVAAAVEHSVPNAGSHTAELLRRPDPSSQPAAAPPSPSTKPLPARTKEPNKKSVPSRLEPQKPRKDELPPTPSQVEPKKHDRDEMLPL